MSEWACRNHPEPDLFYPDSYEQETEAVRFCQTRCLSREACLRAAIDNRETHGVWAGLRVEQLRRLVTGARKEMCGAGLHLRSEHWDWSQKRCAACSAEAKRRAGIKRVASGADAARKRELRAMRRAAREAAASPLA